MFDEKLMKTGTALAAHCNAGTESEALDTLYAEDCVSVEALAMPEGPEEGKMGREANGLDAIRAKHEWWYANNEEHSSNTDGPYFYGDDTFYLIFDMDITDKTSGDRMQMREVGRYQIDGEGKVCREEFSYPPMG